MRRALTILGFSLLAPAVPGLARACPAELDPPQVLARIDALRAQGRYCGARWFAPAPLPLDWSARLARSAQIYARELAARGRLSHRGGGADLGERLGRVAYPLGEAAENLALGPQRLDEVLALWLDSPGHCVNLMELQWREAALACARHTPDGPPVWVLQLGRPAAPRPATAAASR